MMNLALNCLVHATGCQARAAPTVLEEAFICVLSFTAEALHDAERVLAYISIGLLSIFLLEQLLLMYCQRLNYFLHPFQVLDLIIVTVSLVLEVCLFVMPSIQDVPA